MATDKRNAPDELLIHEIITAIVLKDVKRIQSLQKLDASDVVLLEKHAKIYGILMDQWRENAKAKVFVEPSSEA